MEPHVSRSTQSDITLYPGLAGEHFRSITFRQLGLLIGDKREGAFRLEVQRIIAVRDLAEVR